MANVSTNKYYSGQGCLFVADRDSNGKILTYREVGNISELAVTLDATIAEHKESCSGSRLTDARLVTELKASVSMTLQNFTKENLALLFSGQVLDVTSPTAQTDVIVYTNSTGASVTLNGTSVLFTKHLNVNTSPAIVVKQGATAGGATTLTLGTHYTYNYTTGQITFTDGSPTTIASGSNVYVTYTPLAWSGAMMLKNAINKPRAFLFRGLNTVDTNRPVRVELFNVVLDPAKSFDVLTEEFASFQVEGSVLYDSVRDADAELGPFGRVIGDSTL